MDLKFIGRGAAFNVKEGNTNAFFIEDDVLFLIDAGETAFETLMNNHILQNVKEVYVVVSHTHSDHCGSLGSFGLYCKFALQTKMKVILPRFDENYINDIKTLLRIYELPEVDVEYLYDDEIDGRFKSFNKVRYEYTSHAWGLTCFSFVFETNDGAVFYSADTRITDNIVSFMNRYEKIDKMYMEVTDLKGNRDVHLNNEELEKVVPMELRSKVYIMHLRADSVIEKVRNAGFNVVESI